MFNRLLNKLVKPKSELHVRTPGFPSKNKLKGKQFYSPDWKPGDVIMDRYKVENIMAGSMGKVYICEHLGWKIKLAIKSPKPQVIADKEGFKRILTEAKSWVHLGMHPNVAACYYVLSIEKIPHLFIEYIDGGSLDEWIKAGRCKDLRTALSLAIQFCHGMEFTHSKGLIHRDIKPQNILVTRNALLKITDFGILLDQKQVWDITDNGSPAPLPEEYDDIESTIGFRGTPGYASPEQFRDTHNVDKRTDIFSFGLCLWLMLCGRKPFKKNSIRQDIPDPIPANPVIEFPSILKDILKKSVAYDPDDRYPDFASFRADLNEAYKNLYKVTCPYAILNNIDLRADSMNNRAVSLFELNRDEEAVLCLNHSLEINDVLPEAIYNQILLRWKQGASPFRVIRQIEATKQRLPQIAKLFTEIEVQLKNQIRANKEKEKIEVEFPEFRLCPPKVSLEVFREGQLYNSIQRSVDDHLKNKRYEECHNVLVTAWKNNGFRKDRVFNRAYEQLLGIGEKAEVEGCQRFLTIKGNGEPLTCVVSIPGTHTICTTTEGGVVRLLDLRNTKKSPVILGEKSKNIKALAASADSNLLAIGTDDGKITIWSLKQGTILPLELSHNMAVTTLAFSPDSKWLVSGDIDGTFKITGIYNKRRRIVSIPEGGSIRSIVFLTRTLDFITGSDDSKLRYWNIGETGCTRIIDGHEGPLVTFSSVIDGNRMISASRDLTIKVWESSTGRNLKTFRTHEEALTSAIILPDRKTIVTGCVDDTLKIWNAETGDCVQTLDGRGDGITCLANGPRPQTFLAGRHDGSVLFWIVIYRLRFH